MRERRCSQLSLPIQSGRAGIRTRVIGTFDTRPMRHLSHAPKAHGLEKCQNHADKWSYPRFCFTPSSVSGHDCPGQGYLGTRPESLYCDRIVILLSQKHNPPALLPVGRSPSHCHHCQCWWAFTPPFRPLPAPRLRPVWVGFFSVAVVVVCDSHRKHPNLLFR